MLFNRLKQCEIEIEQWADEANGETKNTGRLRTQLIYFYETLGFDGSGLSSLCGYLISSSMLDINIDACVSVPNRCVCGHDHLWRLLYLTVLHTAIVCVRLSILAANVVAPVIFHRWTGTIY